MQKTYLRSSNTFDLCNSSIELEYTLTTIGGKSVSYVWLAHGKLTREQRPSDITSEKKKKNKIQFFSNTNLEFDLFSNNVENRVFCLKPKMEEFRGSDSDQTLVNESVLLSCTISTATGLHFVFRSSVMSLTYYFKIASTGLLKTQILCFLVMFFSHVSIFFCLDADSLIFIVTKFPCASVLVGNIKLVQGGFKDATDVCSILCRGQLPLFIHLSCWLSRSALPSAVFRWGLTLH